MSILPGAPMIAASAAMALVGMEALDRTFLISHDVPYLWKLLSIKRTVSSLINNGSTFAEVWAEIAKRDPKKPYIIDADREVSWSYADVDRLSNQIAWFLKSKGCKQGDVVSLVMLNSAEYVACWLGALKLGCVCALINTNLTGKRLQHCLSVSGCKIVLCGTGVCTDNVAELGNVDGVFQIAPMVPHSLQRRLRRKGQEFKGGDVSLRAGVSDATSAIAQSSAKPVPKKLRDQRRFTQPALLVYTSGTTGLPKAATITHTRLFSMGYAFFSLFRVSSNDIIYTVLPLYHSAGGLCGVGMTMQAGATVVVRRKFSHKNFWADTVKHNCTVIQYIGELCRYLLQGAKTVQDQVRKAGGDPSLIYRQNPVRIAVGNGLRPDIWKDFQETFNIPQIGEFYGSTEGNAALFNFCTSPAAQGAVGRMGPLLTKVSQLRVVKFDVVEEVPVRDKNGFCVECKTGETGELLGCILEDDPLRGFAGYHGNKKATSKKVLENVFVKGDKYFRTGDLLRCDSNGYWYFVDRIGDTFRWKGENVSTTEVAEVVSQFPGFEEVNVYGVALPGHDGRAAMVSFVPTEGKQDDSSPGHWYGVDWKKFSQYVKDGLPSYARPLFFRVQQRINTTGTFKHQKVALRKEGADPSKVSDPLLWYNAKTQSYEPFGQDQWNWITRGQAKL